MAHLGKSSGIQSHSAGETFPYITHLREVWRDGVLVSSKIVVSLAGEELTYADTWAEGDAFARLFKQFDVRDAEGALRALIADRDAAASIAAHADSEKWGKLRDQCTNQDLYQGQPRVTDPVELERIWQARENERVAARQAMEQASEDEVLKRIVPAEYRA
ncbi:MAG: hypothetical protein WAY02_08480 [Burkholderiaceae bacterium]